MTILAQNRKNKFEKLSALLRQIAPQAEHIFCDQYVMELLGVWERVYNLNFNCIEFEEIRSQAGLPNFDYNLNAK